MPKIKIVQMEMKKIWNIIGLFVYVLFIFGCKPKVDSKITIAIASNMQYVAKELAQAFTDQTGILCELVIGSSGKLTAQIIEGAPYDLLLSANMKYPEAIDSRGLAAEPPKIYGFGQLVLWSAKHENISIDKLKDPGIRKVALANPKIAPYGEAAIQVLKHYDLMESVSAKLVFGESISQTNQIISSGAVDVGFTAQSIVLSTNLKETGVWISIPQNSYQPIKQGTVLIDRRQENFPYAKQFYNFLFSPEAHKILKDFGYLVP